MASLWWFWLLIGYLAQWQRLGILGLGGQLPRTPPFEEAFSQVVTRFHRFLTELPNPDYGLFVQDNNESMARRLTDLMHMFHRQGTRWGSLPRLVETPLFVDSSLTGMVQVADICAYAVRRH